MAQGQDNFPPIDKEREEKLTAVHKENVDRLLNWPKVVAVDINYRVKNGEQTSERCILVYVEKKKPERELNAEEILPKELDGVRVDVVEGSTSYC